MSDSQVRTNGAPGGAGGLLERDRELASLLQFVDTDDAAGPRLALIEGQAGIGKSALLAAARQDAEQAGVRVLAARGSQLEREFPFGVVRQLFEPQLVDSASRERALGGAGASAAAVFDSFAGGSEDGGGDVSFASLHGLYWLTVNLAEEDPLLLVIDDLHWVDHPSLRFIAYLVRRLEGVPISVLTATRPNEPGADAELLAEIAADPLTVSIRPAALTVAGVRGVIEERLGQIPDAVFADACHKATGGNPLLLHELMKAIRVEGTAPTAANTDVVAELGPRAASRAVLLRLRRLSDEARQVVRAAAILDEGFDVASLAALAGVDGPVAARATGELAQAEILRGEQPLGFVHPLIRAAVYQDVPPGERELDHARAARLLADVGAPPERIASHLLAVPPHGDEWVAATLRTAAQAATKKGAADTAVALFRRALEEPPPRDQRTEVTLELGLVESLTNAPAAAGHLEAALAGLEDPGAVGLVANVLARATLWERPQEAAALARRIAPTMPAELADMRLSLEAFEAATSAFGVNAPEAVERLADYRDPAAISTLGEKMMAAVASWQWTHANGPIDRCVELALKSLGDDELVAADNGLLPMYAVYTLIAADRDELMAVWDRITRIAHERGSMFGISTIHLWRGYTLYRRGDLPEAELSLRDAVVSFPRYGYGESGTVYNSAHLASVLIERGDLQGARAALDSGPTPDPNVDAWRYWALPQMELLAAEGRSDEVIAIADQFPVSLPWMENPSEVYWHCHKALALDRLGRTDEAIELAQEELALAREWGAGATVGRVLRVLGTIDRERALEHLNESVSLLEDSTTRLEYAKALCAYGTALRLARTPTQAREPLRKALELATVCGADPLADRARTELAATGARPRREALSGVDSLTPSEKRVAELASDGMSNREIAQELFVTPKTVEVHLSNTYRKLEIRSRRELPGALAPA